MNMARLSPILFAFAGIVFLVIGMSRTPEGGRNTTFLVLGLVFLILAAANFRRARAKPPVSTDPRLPARKTQKPGT
jgi:hypothetical protein